MQGTFFNEVRRTRNPLTSFEVYKGTFQPHCDANPSEQAKFKHPRAHEMYCHMYLYDTNIGCAIAGFSGE